MKKIVIFLALITSSFVNAENIDDFVISELNKQNIAGISIGIFKNGQILKAQGYGFANLEHQTPVYPNTIFQTASIGKMFTAMAVMALVEDGVLDLDISIRKYLPDAPKDWQDITLRHLLNHTSGLNYPDIDYKKDYTDDELLQFFYNTKRNFLAGDGWEYSNSGYVTVGIIITKIAGIHYSQIIADRVFKPANMNTARLLSHLDIVPNRSMGYELINGELKNQNWVSISLNETADGSLQMSVLDFANWDAVVAHRQIFKPETWQEIFKPTVLNDGTTFPYGFGWYIEDINSGKSYINHAGAWQGFRSAYRRYEKDGISFVVLANTNYARPELILQGIAERFDEKYKNSK